MMTNEVVITEVIVDAEQPLTLDEGEKIVDAELIAPGQFRLYVQSYVRADR